VLEPNTRVTYSVRQSALRGERVHIAQLSGRAIYKASERTTIHSAGGSLAIDAPTIVVIDGARYAIHDAHNGDGVAIDRLTRDDSLLRTLDDVNRSPEADLRLRLAQLEAMRAALEDERERSDTKMVDAQPPAP